MKKILLGSAVFMLLLASACNDTKGSGDYDKSIMPAGYNPNIKTDTTALIPGTQTINSQQVPGTGTLVPSAAGQMQVAPGNNAQIVQNTPQMQAVQGLPQAGKTAAGMNPPHGQPGHRCDIPEGAPLNSKPTAKTNTPQIITQSPTTASIPTAVKTVTPAGMNPPHGEPGHRCDIPAGSPLNSKPVEAKTAVTPVTPASTTPAVASPAKEVQEKKDN